MIRKQPVKSVIAAILWIVLAALVSTNARSQAPAQIAQLHQENSVRAATLRYNWQTEACRRLPEFGERAVCAARAQAGWKIALALAEARRADTPAAWRKAEQEIAAEEARIQRIAAATRR